MRLYIGYIIFASFASLVLFGASASQKTKLMNTNDVIKYQQVCAAKGLEMKARSNKDGVIDVKCVRDPR